MTKKNLFLFVTAIFIFISPAYSQIPDSTKLTDSIKRPNYRNHAFLGSTLYYPNNSESKFNAGFSGGFDFAIFDFMDFSIMFSSPTFSLRKYSYASYNNWHYPTTMAEVYGVTLQGGLKIYLIEGKFSPYLGAVYGINTYDERFISDSWLHQDAKIRPLLTHLFGFECSINKNIKLDMGYSLIYAHKEGTLYSATTTGLKFGF